MIQDEPRIITERLEIGDFVASNSWLDRFKRQHNIWNMAIAGEARGVSTETVESWNERAREISRGWTAENIWNLDETWRFWREIPEKTRGEKVRRCSGVKQAHKLSKGQPGHFSQTQLARGRIQKWLESLEILGVSKTWRMATVPTSIPTMQTGKPGWALKLWLISFPNSTDV